MPELIRIIIQSATGQYEVRIGNAVLSGTGDQLRPLKIGSKIAIIADASIASTHAVAVEKALEKGGWVCGILKISGGEASKNLNEVTRILSLLAQQKLTRNDTIVAIGGGVIGDLAGFIAATYLRGINLVHVPTTLLAMVDSSIGGKTGVNLPEGKNLVGSFYPPRLVLADTDTLKSLPPRELAAGMAEVIKYGVIADPKMLVEVSQGVPKNLTTVIGRCAEIKADVVQKDERETTGVRAALNFGHTVGHAIENAAGYGTYLHGEAVAIGMCAAAHLSQLKFGLTAAEISQIETALAANNLPLLAKGVPRKKVMEALFHDKKVKDGKINWVLCPRLGETHISSDVTEAELEEVLDLVLV